MIIVTVDINIKADKASEFIEKFQKIVPTVKQEKGCIKYHIYQDPRKKDQLFIFEKWDSKEDLDAHLEKDHMKVFFSEVESLLASEPQIVPFEVKA